MATVESITNAVKALSTQLKSEAQDEAEKALFLHIAVGVMQQEWSAAQGVAAERQAEMVLEARAASGGKPVAQQKEEIAVLLKRRAEDVKASDVVASLKIKD